MTSRTFTIDNWKISFQEEDVGTYNCGLKALCNWHIVLTDYGKFSKEELYKLIDDDRFGREIVKRTVQTNPPSGFFLSAGLTYAADERNSNSARTRDVMAGIARSKKGAWITTPVYDNKGHARADSLQMGMLWWPSPNVKHIVDKKPHWYIPDNIGEGMEERWKHSLKNSTGPRGIHDAIKMVFTNFNFHTRIMFKKPMLKEKPIVGWPTIK
jgi:hypothetical protein